jgi:hypothetical protein
MQQVLTQCKYKKNNYSYFLNFKSSFSLYFINYRIGIIIITITAIQISLGILAIWSLANVESASTGIVRCLKHIHFYLGAVLLLAAW